MAELTEAQWAEIDADFDRQLAAKDAEIERLRAALKPFADTLDEAAMAGRPVPTERMLLYASEGGGTYLGIDAKTLYDARAAFYGDEQKEPNDG